MKSDDVLENATCAVLIEDQIVGTAWLVSDQGHLLTAGHVLHIEKPISEVQVQFRDETPRRAERMVSKFDQEQGLDFAVLKLARPINRPPLPISLAKHVEGSFQLCGYGTRLKERAQSSGYGRFSGTMYLDHLSSSHLFRLESSNLGQEGNSGGAVFSDELQAVVGIQSEAANAPFGPESEILRFYLPCRFIVWHRFGSRCTNWLLGGRKAGFGAH